MRFAETREVTTVTGANGARRIVVPYEDHDGISLLADHASLLARYEKHDLRATPDALDASVAAHPTATLLALANAHEVLSWGTHQPPGGCLAVLSTEPFSQEELVENGIRSSLDVGCLALRGTLVVAAWHSFTDGCDYRHGHIDAPRIGLPAGHYGVTVHRPLPAGDPYAEPPWVFLIELAPTEHRTHGELREVPGADGWFV